MEGANCLLGFDSSPQTKRSSSNTCRVKHFHILYLLSSSQNSTFLVSIRGSFQVSHFHVFHNFFIFFNFFYIFIFIFFKYPQSVLIGLYVCNVKVIEGRICISSVIRKVAGKWTELPIPVFGRPRAHQSE